MAWEADHVPFEAIWEKDGREVFRLAAFARDEAQFATMIDDFFAEFPEYDTRTDVEGLTARVDRTPYTPLSEVRFDPELCCAQGDYDLTDPRSIEDLAAIGDALREGLHVILTATPDMTTLATLHRDSVCGVWRAHPLPDSYMDTWDGNA